MPPGVKVKVINGSSLNIADAVRIELPNKNVANVAKVVKTKAGAAASSLSPCPSPTPVKRQRSATPNGNANQVQNGGTDLLKKVPSKSNMRRKSSKSTPNVSRQCSTVEPELTQEQLNDLLSSSPELLQQYVAENTTVETLEKWTKYRKLRAPKTKVKKSGLSKWKFSRKTDKRDMLEEMTRRLNEPDNKVEIMWELTECIGRAVNAETAQLYLSEEPGTISKYVPAQGDEPSHVIGSEPIVSGTTIAAHCATVKDFIITHTKEAHEDFPQGIPDIEGNVNVLAHPICSEEEELEAVLVLVRRKTAFTEEDIEKINRYLVWGGVAIFYADNYSIFQHHKQIKNFLTSVVKSVFQETISLDALIIQILNHVQKIVDADRASLFLMDTKTNQLFARVFDITSDDTTEGIQQASKDIRDKIRFLNGKGIAGQVALTNETINVKDAYQDERFDPSTDELTGYKTKSVLGTPISIRGSIIGVSMLVNKNNQSTFTKEDEEALELFSTYCGLALHHAKLYDKIRQKEAHVKVTQEVLAYHNNPAPEDVAMIRAEGVPKREDHSDLADQIFMYYALGHSDMSKARKALFMFTDLFGPTRFNYDTLVLFIMTVMTNYRSVIYHNWSHGFHVANTIYSILKSSPDVFTPLESLAMFVGAICHDMDHRGFNNKFMIDIGSPLSKVYSTSTMENHHFQMGMGIIQQEHHNIFQDLTEEEYKKTVTSMKHCILATDLALFFPNKARFANIVKENSFDWEVSDHRLLAQALCMTGSDLCSSAKPWVVQWRISQVVYAEFHEQGDVEKALGWKPIPLFDSANFKELASMQVGFLGGICIPCYELLIKVMPNLSPLWEQCVENSKVWKGLAQIRKREKEKEAEEKERLEKEEKEKEEKEKQEKEEKEETGKEDTEDKEKK